MEFRVLFRFGFVFPQLGQLRIQFLKKEENSQHIVKDDKREA